MTNTLFMLNVDCEMYALEPHRLLFELHVSISIQNKRETARLFNVHRSSMMEDDPFENQMGILFEARVIFYYKISLFLGANFTPLILVLGIGDRGNARTSIWRSKMLFLHI